LDIDIIDVYFAIRGKIACCYVVVRYAEKHYNVYVDWRYSIVMLKSLN